MELINKIDQTFIFDKNKIRIIGTYEEPWFVVKDLCNILGIKDNRSALRSIPDKWKKVEDSILTLGGEQIMSVINEAGLYKLIMRSNKPIAEKFQEYVCEEILPSIRKTGEFNLQKQLQDKENQMQKQLEEKDNKIKEIQCELNKKTAQAKKKNIKKGELIYMGINEIDKKVFKVGITCNASSRMSGLSCGTTTDFEMKHIWYTNFNKEIEDLVKKNFQEQRYTLRKELYGIEVYEEVYKYIDLLVKILNETERHPSSEEEKIPTNKIRVNKNPLCLREKSCNICNETQPLENFHKAEDHVDKHENTCKKCAKKRQEEYIEIKRETIPLPTEKICTGCNTIYPLDNFYEDKQKFDKKGTKCKECFKKIQYRDDKEKVEISEYCCATCQVIKPIDEFHKLSRSKTGHKYSCKMCELKKAKERYDKNKEVEFSVLDDKQESKSNIIIINEDEETKNCSYCNKLKNISSFYKIKSKISAYCIECSKEKQRAYNKNKKSEIL